MTWNYRECICGRGFKAEKRSDILCPECRRKQALKDKELPICDSLLDNGTCEALDTPCVSPGRIVPHGQLCPKAHDELSGRAKPKFSKDVPAHAKVRSEEIDWGHEPDIND